ncbi:MAG: dihydropyrimidine dehydrogenase, partial [Nitrospirae bacterium]|nr:dihydropyrimidine dehydrogenase [Nitrospirota bacterium]
MAELSQKERMKIKRHDMPNQDQFVRRGNYDEVALGYSLETAREEAERCIQCKEPKCVQGCP